MGDKIKVATIGENKLSVGDISRAMGDADVVIVDNQAEAQMIIAEYKMYPHIDEAPMLRGPSRADLREEKRLQRRFRHG